MDRKELKKLIILTRNDVKKYVVNKLFKEFPDIANSVTSKMYQKCEIFMDGYIEGISMDIMPPINKDEWKEHLLEKSYEYILRQFD